MRRPAVIVLCLFAIVACSDGGSKSTAKAQHVPIPRVSLPAGAKLDREAWIKLWRETPGAADERCLDVGGRTDVRSGGFVVGNFAAFREGWDGTEANSKLYYIPLHPSPPMPLEIAATQLSSAPPRAVTLQFGPPTAWTLDGIPFYVTGTVLPERGRWRLEAVAGGNRGCFELQL